MSDFITILKEHYQWKHQIFKLAISDIKKTYNGAAIGWAWSVIKPTVIIFVYWFAMTVGLRVGGEVQGYPFILWLIIGMVPWFYMSEMLTQGGSSLNGYSYLVTKMKFPISTIPTFVGISKLFVNLCLLIVALILFMGYGIATGDTAKYFPDIYMLQLPIYMLCMVMIFTVWGLFSSLLSAISIDFQNLVEAFVTALFWLSGIIWDINTIATPLVKKILMFNPVTFIATGYRNVFIYKIWIWEQPRALVSFLIVLLIMFLLEMWAYKRLRKEIPDVL